MWSIEARAGAERAFAAAVYLGAVIAFLLVQELGLRLRDEEHREWWAGTGRDLLNAAGLLAIAGGLRLLGLGWPAALLVGGTLTLAMFGTSVFVATQTTVRHPLFWTFGFGLGLATAVLVFDREVVEAFGAAAGALFSQRQTGR